MSLFGSNASSDIRKGYSMKEKKDILQYIANRHAYSEVKGRRFWVEFAISGKTTRTWQSLKEVYIKRILPDIRNPYYGLSLEDIKKFSSGSYTNVDAKNIEWLKNEKVKNIFTESSGSCIPNTTVTPATDNEQKDNHQNKVVPPDVCALDSDTDIELVSVRARASPTQEATQEIESSIALPGTSSENSVEESLANLPGAINTSLNSEDKARVTLRLSPDIISERETQFTPNKFKETFLLLDSEDSSDIKNRNIMDKCSRQKANLFGFSTGKPTLISNNTKRRRDMRDSKGYRNNFKPTSSNAIAFSTPSKHQTFKKFRGPPGTETSTDCQSEDSTDSEGQYIPLRSGGDQRGKGKGQKMYCSLNGNLIQLYQSKHRKCSERQKIYTHFQDNCKHGKQMKKQKSCYIDDEPKTALKQSQALVFNRNEKIDNTNQQILNYWKMKYISEKKRSNDIFRLLSMEKNTPFVNNSSEQKLPIENPTITISNNRPMEPNMQEKVKSTASKTNLDYQLPNEKPSVIQNSNLATSTVKPSTAAKDFNQNEKRDLLMVKYAKNSNVDAMTKAGLDNNVILIDTQKANILFDLLRKLTDSKIPTDNSQELDSKSENTKSTQVQNEESVELVNVENYQLKTQNGTVSKTYTNIQNDGKLELPHKTLIETQKDEVDDIFISLDREGSSSCISKNELDSKQTDKDADKAQDGEVTKSLISVQSSEAQPADNTKSRGVRNEKSMKLQNADKYQLRTRNAKMSETPKNKENIGKLELSNKTLTKTQKDEIDEIFFSLDQEDGSSSTSKRNDSTEDTDVVKNIRDKENKIFEQILSEDTHEDLSANRCIFSPLEVKMLLNENSHEGDSLLNPKSLENENNLEFLPQRRGRKSKTSPKNVTSDTVRRSYRIQPCQDASLTNLEGKKKETVLNVSVEQNGADAKQNTKSQGTPLGQGYLAKRKFNDNKRKIENDSDIDEEARFKINPKFFEQASSKTRNKKSKKNLRHSIKIVPSSSESDEMESFRFTLPEFSIDTSRLNKRQTENNPTNWFTDGPTTSSQNRNRFNKLFNSNYPTKYKYHITNNCAVDNISKDNFGNPSVDLNPFQQQCDSLQQSDNKMYEEYAEKNYNYYCNPNLETDDIIDDSCEESEEIPLQNGLFDFIKKRKTSKCLALSINHVLENEHRLGSESNVNLALPLMEQDIDLYNIDKNDFLSNIEQSCTQASSVIIDVTGNNSSKEKVKKCINDVPIMKFSRKVSVGQDAHEISAAESLSPCIDRFLPYLSQNSMVENPSKVPDDEPEVDTLTKYSTKQADSHDEIDTLFSDEDSYLDPPQDSLCNNNISLFDSSPTQNTELDVMLKVKELHKVEPEISPNDVENSNSKIEPKTVIINSGHGDEISLTNAKTLVSEDLQKTVYLEQWKDIMTEDESD